MASHANLEVSKHQLTLVETLFILWMHEIRWIKCSLKFAPVSISNRGISSSISGCMHEAESFKFPYMHYNKLLYFFSQWVWLFLLLTLWWQWTTHVPWYVVKLPSLVKTDVLRQGSQQARALLKLILVLNGRNTDSCGKGPLGKNQEVQAVSQQGNTLNNTNLWTTESLVYAKFKLSIGLIAAFILTPQ